MPVKIRIVKKDIVLDAELFDTETAKSIAAALPIEVEPNEWGGRVLFRNPCQDAAG